jgi:hypothetical protein
MIGRLIRGVWGVVLYFALATLIAEGIMTAYLRASGRLDGEKLAQVLGVLQGIPEGTADKGSGIGRRNPASTANPQSPIPNPPSPAPEAVSYDQVLEARAVKDKNLQLRALALDNDWAQLKSARLELADAQKRYKLQLTDFNSRLDSVAKGAKVSGREEVRRILESIKPKQAKELVLGMLDNKEDEEVVLLLSGMTDSKRAKLLGEFKTADENKKIDEVLRRIRQGVPEAPLVETAKGQLKPPGPTGL